MFDILFPEVISGADLCTGFRFEFLLVGFYSGRYMFSCMPPAGASSAHFSVLENYGRKLKWGLDHIPVAAKVSQFRNLCS